MTSPHPETVLGQLRWLTTNATPVTAANHATFHTLREVDPSLVDADAVVARQKRIERQLGSGATNLLTLEHVTGRGRRILNEQDDNPTVGRITTRIEVARPFEFRSHRHDEQFTQLDIEFDQDGSIHFAPEGSIPFDEIMEADTRDEWAQWGVELNYALTQEGGHFAMRPMPDCLGAIAAKLTTLE